MDQHAALAEETASRRTFAIISHPDAGKTTLTEKFLLYAGTLRSAGSVRGRKGGAGAVSDWMTMERERGISITSSVLRIPWGELLLTILDTPGHVDFSDDTYRTLTAADCAVLVVDATKGVETQTRKLCEVCRLRRIPVMVLVNKMDLEGIEPLELLSQLERELELPLTAFNWPSGQGREFRGVVDRGLLDGTTRRLHLFERQAAGGAVQAASRVVDFPSAEAEAAIGPERVAVLREELELLDVAGNEFHDGDFLAGTCSPVFFASALTNFGLEPFFAAFLRLAPPPHARTATGADGQEQPMEPTRHPFSGYVYKIQANMDPRHRDSLAFVRVCTGRFARDEAVEQVREGRSLGRNRISRAYTLAGRDRETIDEAFPGDVVAIPNKGLAVGDSLSAAGAVCYPRLPQFTPSIFGTVELRDPEKRKQYDRALELLGDEGTVLLLDPITGGRPIVGVLGRLQLEVLQHRMQEEYGVRVEIRMLPYTCSAWVEGELKTFYPGPGATAATDRSGRLLALFESEWALTMAERSHKEHRFSAHR